MKRRYILSMITITVSSMLFFTGCSREYSKNLIVNSSNGQEKVEDTDKSNIVSNDDSNKGSNEIDSVKEEYNDVKEVVESGYEDVEAFLDNEYANNAFQGVALVAVGDEIKFAKAYGYADEDEVRKNTLTTRFAIASNTKQFTAAAIMQLVEKGKINLDYTIDKYFPKYKYGSEITVRELLQMRSGIPDYLNEIDAFMKSNECLNIIGDYVDDEYFDKYVEDDRWSKDVILNDLYLTDLYFNPNEEYDYCNTNYYLLGLIIEQASGLSYDDYIKDNIFKPCNMITASMKAEDNDAKGHGSEVSGEIDANPNFTYAAGNIHANVYDILRWNRMFHKGNIVSKESYKEMTTPVDGYGFGLFISEDGLIRHSGVIDGFNSNTEYNPKTDTTIIVLENMDANTGMLDAKYDTSIIHSLINY